MAVLIGFALFVIGCFGASCAFMAYRLATGREPWPPRGRKGVWIKDGRWETDDVDR
jgi:hypothetical protein